MSLSLDDKLLGEKVHYYCSSSEESDGEDSDERDDEDVNNSRVIKDSSAWSDGDRQAENNGIVTNTGPKGVLKDWREFKRLETEKREEQEKDKLSLAKKLTLTCRSHLNDEEEKDADAEFLAQLEDLEDEFLKEYRLKRIEEMRHALAEIPKFGKLISLTAHNFLEEVDGENPGVTIIVHIFEQHVPACETMNGCLGCLANEYPTIKFCRLSASDARMSFKFSEEGVPALLVYKNKELIGNFIRLGQEFGDDFYANDIESFLQEHSFLPSKESMYVIRDKTTGEIRGALQEDEDSGSDFDID
ncbi:phosducin-like protein [Aplysia californica]|uniref:Phosducin-like protein n=1 Tax=Aplysia californica TaxID=6500 RepID=A0ABM0JKN4_APLCA|nr:phosducin-like protein [Aplysia californica]XP_005095942.1 phosducin-like protein [Aplysia californica]